MKKIGLFDIDGTIYDGYLIFPLSKYFVKKGLISNEVLTSLKNAATRYRAGKQGYEFTQKQVNKILIEGLRGRRYTNITSLAREFIDSQEKNFYKYVKPLLSNLKKLYDVYFITGEFQFIAKACADKFGVKGYRSAVCEVEDDIISGKVSKDLAYSEEKRDVVLPLLEKYSVAGSFAVGDSVGDVEMLKLVENAFCINPSEGLKEVANERGWKCFDDESVSVALKNLLD